MGVTCSTNGREKKLIQNFYQKTWKKRPHGRPTRRRLGNIRMELREIRWEDVYWINLAQDRDQWRALVIMVMNLKVPLGRGGIS
jgi:hypothetical protein